MLFHKHLALGATDPYKLQLPLDDQLNNSDLVDVDCGIFQDSTDDQMESKIQIRSVKCCTRICFHETDLWHGVEK